jgi:4-hydroxybenzoate polyprenyltransferase
LKLINTFIFSNIFLSFGAVLLTVSAQVQLGMKPHWQPYLLLIFFATLIEYNRNRLIKLINDRGNLDQDRRRWAGKEKKLLSIVMALSIAGFLIAALHTKSAVLLAFLPLGLLSFFYLFPLSRHYFFGLREIPYIKIFVIAFVWSATTIFLPVVNSGTAITEKHVVLLFAERFFFIFAISIPFDIRDMQADRDSGLKTIPLIIDKNKALLLSYLSLSICFTLSIIHYKMQNNWFIIEAIFVSLITTYLFLKMGIFREQSRYYYPILDGTILLQGLLVLGFYYLAHGIS